MKITLIGASGFVGTNLMRILQENHQLKNIDIETGWTFRKLTVTGDVRDGAQMDSLITDADMVVLLAA